MSRSKRMKWIVEHHSDSCPRVPCCQNEDVTLGLHLKLLLPAALLIATVNTMTVGKKCNEETSSFPLHADDFD